MKKKILGILGAIILAGASVASAGEVMSHAEMRGVIKASHADFIYCVETYRADIFHAESLDDIVEYYMQKNTYSIREHNEFKEGIMEANPWLYDRENARGQIMVGAGEEIVVYYWKRCK